MCSILPINTLRLDQSDIGFIDQARGLQAIARALAKHVVAGHPLELSVHQWHEAVECRTVAATARGRIYGCSRTSAGGRDGSMGSCSASLACEVTDCQEEGLSLEDRKSRATGPNLTRQVIVMRACHRRNVVLVQRQMET